MPPVDFLGVGDFGVSTRADTVFPPRVACVSRKRGRARREQDHIIFYLLLLSRGHPLHHLHRDVQLVRRLRRALSFMDTLSSRSENYRSVVGRWGGEPCMMISA